MQEKLKKGDIVKIVPEYLEDGEDPDREYIVLENYGDGIIKIYTKTYEHQIGTSNIVADFVVYKVGEVPENN